MKIARDAIQCTILLCCHLIVLVVSTCTIPSDIQGTWISSDQGSITFNSTYITGYDVHGKGSLAFECHLQSGSYYIFRSESFPLYSSTGIATMCVSFTQIKTSLYSYTIYTAELLDANSQRLVFMDSTATVTQANSCTDTSSSVYYLMVKDGEISSLKIQCPDPFLGKFSYSYGESSCSNNTGRLDVCTDVKQMDFNLTACSTKMAYSNGGKTNCLYFTESDSTYTLHVYNLDNTTDESSTYRFTCYKITSSGGYVYATEYPQNCHENQTSTYVLNPGGNLTLIPSETCVPATATETEATVASASMIIAIVLVLIVLLIIIVLIIIYCCWKKKKRLIDPVGTAPADTAMPNGRLPSEDNDEDDDVDATRAMSTFAEPPTAHGTVYIPGSAQPTKEMSRELSRGISLHFENENEKENDEKFQRHEKDLRRAPHIEECPMTQDSVRSKDPHWTPTFDGNVRPRLELSYVKPEDYNGVLHGLQPHQGSREGKNLPQPTIVEEPTLEDSPPSSPTPNGDVNDHTTKKKKKKKKKKKVLKIKEADLDSKTKKRNSLK